MDKQEFEARLKDAVEKTLHAEAKQAYAATLRHLQAELMQAYDIAKALERSILTPQDERTPKHSVDEVLLAIDLDRLQRALQS